jgi:hypothetical protein
MNGIRKMKQYKRSSALYDKLGPSADGLLEFYNIGEKQRRDGNRIKVRH